MKNVWVIKDEKGNYVSSIRKIEESIVGYISYHTIQNGVYMMYANKERASVVLGKLNQAKTKYGFDVEFYIEETNSAQLINEMVKFKGKNMILIERECAA